VVVERAVEESAEADAVLIDQQRHVFGHERLGPGVVAVDVDELAAIERTLVAASSSTSTATTPGPRRSCPKT
ncbi:MAG: hypothetical protein AAF797_01810, partial [Planctomycetota bacterium]